jgi:hypothetical protein
LRRSIKGMIPLPPPFDLRMFGQSAEEPEVTMWSRIPAREQVIQRRARRPRRVERLCVKSRHTCHSHHFNARS